MNAERLRQLFPNASEDFLAKNSEGQVAKASPVNEAPPIRQNRASRLNKTETAFLEHLRAEADPRDSILSQALNLEIANGCRYRPDFVVVRPRGSADEGVLIAAYEIKAAHIWDDSIVKLKVAARAYPWIEFWLAKRESRSSPFTLLLVVP